jgi:hypothetical protein
VLGAGDVPGFALAPAFDGGVAPVPLLDIAARALKRSGPRPLRLVLPARSGRAAAGST